MAIVQKAKSIIEKAKAFAATKHAGQRRKYTDEPYAAHLLAVVGILARHGIRDPNVLAAAYLHDTVEDTKITIAEILEAFNAPVAELVYWLTDTETGNRKVRMMMAAWRLGRAPWHAKLIHGPARAVGVARTIPWWQLARLCRMVSAQWLWPYPATG